MANHVRPLVLSLALLVALAISASQGAYQLQQEYSGSTFFDGFDFWGNNADPTHGYVYYTTRDQALEWGLAVTSPEGAYIKADSWSVSTGSGRAAVRMQTKTAFNTGLFIADIAHMPTGCGTWPAYWMNGPNPWPTGGEIDIVEGVHNNRRDKSTLHTTNGCDMSSVPTSSFKGYWDDRNGQTLTNCYVDAYLDNNGNSLNLGCGVWADEENFGAALNAGGGGVYATEWTNTGIKFWFFWRNSIPSDILNGNPDPSSWGLPYGNFEFGSNCPSSHFHDQNIIINLTFCGDWAGNVWDDSGCKGDGNAATCQLFVQNNPQAFQEAYWLFKSIKVYQWN